MTEKNNRKSISNFLVKPSFQIKIIAKIIIAMVISSACTTLLIAWAYHTRSQTGGFYYLSNDLRKDIELTSIVEFILPALIISQTFAILITIGISLFTSRLAAVPTYKMQKWAAAVRAGNLHTRLAFREHDAMYEVTKECNMVVETMRKTVIEIREATLAIEQSPQDPAKVLNGVEGIKKALELFQTKA